MSKPQDAFLIMSDEDRRVLAEVYAALYDLNRDLWRTALKDGDVAKHVGQALGALWLLGDHFELDMEAIRERAEVTREALKAESAKKVC
jgi:hypothetical protein